MSANDELLQLLKTYGVDATKLNANELKIIQDIALKYEVRTPTITTTTVGDLSGINLTKLADGDVVGPPVETAKLDLMGGLKSKLGEGWTNYHRLAIEGIADEVPNLGKHFTPGQLAEVVANNPQAEFLPHISPLLKQGGTVTVRGNFSNGFFKKIWDGKASGLSDFDLVSKTENVVNPGYLRTDGTLVTGQIHEIVLRKK